MTQRKRWTPSSQPFERAVNTPHSQRNIAKTPSMQETLPQAFPASSSSAAPSSAPPSSPTASPATPLTAQQRTLIKRIQKLDLSPKATERYTAFAMRPRPKRILGVPFFSPSLPKGVRSWTWLGSLTFVYYFYKGMWRKAISIIVLAFLVVAGICYDINPQLCQEAFWSLINQQAPSEDFIKLFLKQYNNWVKLFMLLCTYQMLYDDYRHSVLQEKFWW